MSRQTTEPSGWYSAVGQQRPALIALTYLADTWPGLPPVYMTVHTHDGNAVALQTDSAADVEVWRTALQVPAASVVMNRYTDYTSIEFSTAVCGIEVAVYGRTPLDPARAERSPAEDAEHRARVAQQPTAVERGRAEADAWNAAHPIGTPVAAYPQTREDEPLLTRTRSEAWTLGHGAPVVLVEGYAGGICLTHVDVRTEPAPGSTTAVVPLADAKGGAL